MAGAIVDKTVSITWFGNGIYGYEASAITENATDSEPVVEDGSKIEISNEIYSFTGNESITGWSGISNSTQAYIYFVPAGSACTVIFSATAPTWDTAKNGWYNGNNRAIWAVYRDSSGSYTSKNKMGRKGETVTAIINVGDWNMDTSAAETISIPEYIDYDKIFYTTAIIRNDTDALRTDINIAGSSSAQFSTDTINLGRTNSGYYDDPAFQNTSYNRGWIYIVYKV